MVDNDWEGRWPDPTAVDQILGREDELAQIRRFLEGLRAGRARSCSKGSPASGRRHSGRRGSTRRESSVTRSCSLERGRRLRLELSFAGLADICGPVADEVLPILPDPQRRALEVALLLEEPEGGAFNQRAVAAALLGALRQLSGRRPLVIAIDDVQWLDASSAAVLEFALRRIRVEPVGALLSWRLGNRTPVPSSFGQVSSARGASRIEALGRLG